MTVRTAGKLTIGAAGAALLLSGCGNGGDDGEVNLTFSWWGGEARHQYTQEMVELFEEEHPDISVDVRYHEWDNYWDQLATQTAGGDTPDVMQMDLVYLREYIESGVLLELDQVNTDEFADELMDTGIVDSTLYAMPVGSTALTMGTNTALLEESGIEIPDDETWTWDDLLDLASEVSEESDTYGLAGSFDSGSFHLYLRQNYGVDTVEEDGELPWGPDEAAEYFEMLGEFQDAGAYPSPAQMAEQRGIAREQTLLATGQAAMFPAWDAMLIALSSNDGVDLEPLMLPSETGDATDAGMYYKASMFYSAAAATDHPEEAQMLIDFMVNNQEAGELQDIERGVPGNDSIRESIREDLDGVEARVVDYADRIEDVVGEAPPLQPEGFGAVQDIVIRYEDEFFFERLTAEEAGQQMYQEIADLLN